MTGLDPLYWDSNTTLAVLSFIAFTYFFISVVSFFAGLYRGRKSHGKNCKGKQKSLFKRLHGGMKRLREGGKE